MSKKSKAEKVQVEQKVADLVDETSQLMEEVGFLSFDDLSPIEQRIYQDAYMNVPVRTLAKAYGFGHDENARIAFHKKYQRVLDLAHLQHQRDLRAAQWELAVTKLNPTMLVWLGKQAGQTDIVPTTLGEEAPEVADPTVVNIVYPPMPERKEKEDK